MTKRCSRSTTPTLPIHRRGHRGHRGHRQTAGGTQSRLALAAADDVTHRHQRDSRAAERALERARYEADRAERAFCQVEPENRLVARTLKARWETKLAALADTEQALAAAQDAFPPLPTRLEVEKLAADLPGLWQAPTTSNKDANGCSTP